MDVVMKTRLRQMRGQLVEHNAKGAELEASWEQLACNCEFHGGHGVCSHEKNRHFVCRYVVCPELDS